LVEFSVQHHG